MTSIDILSGISFKKISAVIFEERFKRIRVIWKTEKTDSFFAATKRDFLDIQMNLQR